jgi:ABC-2 type transport system permease protein
VYKRQNYLDITALLQILFCATVAPELLCPDRRNRTLSLYFAHPISRLDYAAMKALALITALLAIALGPQVFLFIGRALGGDGGLDYLRDNAAVIPRILLAAGTVSLYLAMLALAIASLTARRIFAAGGFIALLLISSAAAGAIWSAFEEGAARAVIVLSLGELPFGATSWIFGVPFGEGSLARAADLPGELLFIATLAWAALGLLVVVWRYATWEP